MGGNAGLQHATGGKANSQHSYIKQWAATLAAIRPLRATGGNATSKHSYISRWTATPVTNIATAGNGRQRQQPT